MKDEAIRNSVFELMETMDSLEQQDIRGFRRANLLDPTLPDSEVISLSPSHSKFTTVQLEKTHYQLLSALVIPTSDQQLILPHEAVSLPEISTGGVCYSSVSSKPHDSNLIFRCPRSGSTRVGSISLILQYTYRRSHDNAAITSHFLIINECALVTENTRNLDPFIRFGFAGGFLCSPTFSTVHAIPLSNIISHCAVTPMSGEFSGFVHIMPLDRVSSTVICF